MKLFQFAILYHPKAKKDAEPEPSELVVGVTTVLAKNEKTVAIMASREIPEKYKDKLDDVEIVVRPF